MLFRPHKLHRQTIMLHLRTSISHVQHMCVVSAVQMSDQPVEGVLAELVGRAVAHACCEA